MIDGIIFCKSLPVTLRLQGSGLCSDCISVIFGHIDPDICKLGLMLDVYLVIIPELCLGLEARLDEGGEVTLARSFLTVNLGGQPDPRLHVHAPAVKMEIGVVVRFVRVCAVEA